MRVGVAGASGYAGTELLRLLAGHPCLEACVATAERHEGEAVAARAPSLAAAYPSLRYAPTTPAALAGLDAVFLALPHGRSGALAADLAAEGTLVVDLGADLRLDETAWADYYGGPHPAPELAAGAACGLVERHRDELATARVVAVPGCYPTAAVLATAPLLDAGLFGPGTVVVDAISGASGAGTGLDESLHFAALQGDVAAYGLCGHRHTPEMARELGRPVCFTPHLAPLDRGLVATCTAPAAEGADTAAAMAALHEAYDAEPFVVVADDPPHPKAVRGTNLAHVSARVDARTGTLLALGAIDNLGKGAAGQAVQCANVALGLDETAGLARAGVWP